MIQDYRRVDTRLSPPTAAACLLFLGGCADFQQTHRHPVPDPAAVEQYQKEMQADVARQMAEAKALVDNATREKKIADDREDSRRRQAYLDSHPGLTIEVREAISKGQAQIGMSADEVQASFGPPDRVNRSGDAYGVTEQWIYERFDQFLYFSNGRLKSWQEFNR